MPEKTKPVPMRKGTPPYKRHPVTAARVADLLSLDVPLADVCARVGMGLEVLRRLYRQEIEAAALQVGDKPHRYNAETARQIKACAQVGLDQRSISRIVGIHRDKIRELYSEDVEIGRAHGEMNVAKHVYRRATSMKDQMPQVTSSFFYLKARAGWRDADAVEISGPDGGPIRTQSAIVIIPSNGRENLIIDERGNKIAGPKS